MKQMIRLDEKRETVAISGYPAFLWSDRRLKFSSKIFYITKKREVFFNKLFKKWDKNKYFGVDSIRIPFEYIWHPGIVLHSNTDGEYDPTGQFQILFLLIIRI